MTHRLLNHIWASWMSETKKTSAERLRTLGQSKDTQRVYAYVYNMSKCLRINSSRHRWPHTLVSAPENAYDQLRSKMTHLLMHAENMRESRNGATFQEFFQPPASSPSSLSFLFPCQLLQISRSTFTSSSLPPALVRSIH